ncbi:tail fiber assembly protein [Yokenella regensburgei]|uniref:tail fiber assembly protein n=1 Tax=Yokenella regensburgei TaxID=158877 RepID=UPI0013760B77|nr:tail fiber assembly protein [Yokenella regensburgei]KAF1367124.1 hypothetical protein FHR25_004339 [Yokenella regensburgei]
MEKTNKKEYPLSAGAEFAALLQTPGDMGPQLEKTESNFYFSPAELVFVACVMKKDYVKAGSWPQDARPVSDETYSTFVATPPEGKALGADKKGQPRWINKPAPTPEQLIEAAERKKDRLMSDAERTLAPLERAVRLGIATEEEKTRLKEWETYSVLLSRVNTSKPEWPPEPDNVA